MVTDRLFQGDCLDILPQLPEASVQLVITSPPYNVGWDYGPGFRDLLPLEAYQAWTEQVLAQLLRVLRPGGVLAYNVPPSIKTPDHRAFPLAAWVQARLFQWEQEGRGWKLREPQAWIKSRPRARIYATSTAIGNYKNPHARHCYEVFVLASKECYQIDGRDGRWPGDAGRFGSYLEAMKDVWMPTDSWFVQPGRAKRGEPLAFPPDLVRRLVWIYSNPGDVVLDPFAGTGSVLPNARALERSCWLIELRPQYRQRLEQLLSYQLPLDDGVTDSASALPVAVTLGAPEDPRCTVCRRVLDASRRDARTCSAACRQKAYRQRRAAARLAHAS